MSQSFLEVCGWRNGVERAPGAEPGWEPLLPALSAAPCRALEQVLELGHAAGDGGSSPVTLCPFLFFLPFQLLLNKQWFCS